jgi:isoflavone 2'-hydroxylase
MFLGIRRDEVRSLLCRLGRNSRKDFAKVEQKSMFSELTFNIIMRMVVGKCYYGYGEKVNNEEEAKQFRKMMLEIVESAGASNPGEFVPIF